MLVNAEQATESATPTGKPVIAVKGLTASYPTPNGVVTPIDGFDLTVHEREVVGLVGDAGSGKSTAALAMMGIIRPPGVITAGSVHFGDRDLLTQDEEALRKIRGNEIGIIVQNPRGSLNPMLRVGKQIANVYGAHNKATAREERQRAIEMLRMVGINDPERRVNAYAHELSGGMAQRALIAMALSSSPRLLIADEPTSGLDVTIQAQFLDEMWQTVQKTGSAILLISQDLGVIANYCDRVVVLHDGKIVEDRPVREFFGDPHHAYSQSILALQKAAGDATPAAAEKSVPPEPLIAIDGLAKDFPIRGSDKVVQAVQALTMTIGKGETLGLVGESGSGKTTVGRCLLRLEEPTAGTITYRGDEIGSIPPRAMRRFRSKLQIVFQDPYDSINPRWTTGQILREPLDLHTSLSRAEKAERVRELLRLVDLPDDIISIKPRQLGAGALQRLNIARAIATDPEFIVLDEPTSVLAPGAIDGLVRLLRRLQSEFGLSYLFISHDLTTVKYLCDRVAVMYLGQVVETGTVDQVFSDPQHPYSRSLLDAHLYPDPTGRRVDRTDIEQLEGEIPSPIDLPKGCYLASRCPHATDRCRTEPQVLTELPGLRQARCWRVDENDWEDGH
ncbi:dipeptide ABC transporter ATP-binding protein [Hoeflea sp.]|uniref:dipeptide ABC transporter ATP-binding protein n=1 Tax=Hoeflea sp. TaxID=1940281 RepID=UPI003B0256E9